MKLSFSQQLGTSIAKKALNNILIQAPMYLIKKIISKIPNIYLSRERLIDDIQKSNNIHCVPLKNQLYVVTSENINLILNGFKIIVHYPMAI